MWSMDSYSQTDTLALGLLLGNFAPPGVCFALRGDLGSGKTLLTKGIAKGMGIMEEITSPTFTIVNQYLDGKCVLNHMDAYRINDEDELYELGIEEYFDNSSINVIEWPDILGVLLPVECVNINIDKRMDDEGNEWRHIVITADKQNQKWLEEVMSKYAYTIT